MRKVLIATPMYNGTCTSGYTASMIELFKKYSKTSKVELDFMYGINEALVTRARNMCANIFMKSDFDNLLFIDADIEFNAEQLIKMIEIDRDFVVGVYPKKTIDWKKVKQGALMGIPEEHLQNFGNEYLFIPSTPEMKEDSEGLVEIDRVGTGMMMLSRNVFKKLSGVVNSFRLEAPVTSNVKFGQEEEYKEYFYTSIDPKTKIFLHEDFTLCKLWREMGEKIYGAPWVTLKHIGNHTFG